MFHLLLSIKDQKLLGNLLPVMSLLNSKFEKSFVKLLTPLFFDFAMAIFNSRVSTVEKLRLAFQAYDSKHRGRILLDDVEKMVTCSLLLYCAEVSREDIRTLVSKLLDSFRSAGARAGGELVSFSVFKEKALETPVLCDLLLVKNSRGDGSTRQTRGATI